MKASFTTGFTAFLPFFLTLIFSCQQHPLHSQMEAKPPYHESIIHANGILLHYLDWGGSGQPLIFIHGLGDSPFIFQELADSLKDNFRIIAYSRRGHYKSETSDQHYDNATLVDDLKLLMDSLNISKASLLGWSMGGNEITEFAIRYPERITKLIYLESGYDYSGETFKNIVKSLPYAPVPGNAELKSLTDFRNWYHNYWFSDIAWNPVLEANLKASTRLNPDSSVAIVPNDSNFKIFLESLVSYPRDYRKINAPALAFYTNHFFVPPVKDSNIVTAYADIENNTIKPWRIKNKQQLKTELKNLTLVELPNGSHSSLLFLDRDTIINSIQAFLAN